MRGTVHLLPAGDLPIYIGALKRSGTHEVERWLAGHEVSANEVHALSEAIVQALEGGPLTRHALAEQVVCLMGEKARPWVEHSWGGVVKHAALQGRVCFGSDWQGQVTFVRVDQWLPQFTEMPEQEAGSALLCRYLGGYGPAGLEDFRQWSGMTMKEARQIRDRLGDALLEVAIEGRPALVLRDDLSEVQKELLDDRSVFLLPSFDPYMLGHKDKNHLVDSLHYKSVYRQAGWLSPVVLHKGRVVGTWSYKHRGSRLSVTVEAFEALPRGVREKIAEEADDLGRFLEATTDLVET